MDDAHHELAEGNVVEFTPEAAPCEAEVRWVVLVGQGGEGEAGGPGVDEVGRAGGGEEIAFAYDQVGGCSWGVWVSGRIGRPTYNWEGW